MPNNNPSTLGEVVDRIAREGYAVQCECAICSDARRDFPQAVAWIEARLRESPSLSVLELVGTVGAVTAPEPGREYTATEIEARRQQAESRMLRINTTVTLSGSTTPMSGSSAPSWATWTAGPSGVVADENVSDALAAAVTAILPATPAAAAPAAPAAPAFVGWPEGQKPVTTRDHIVKGFLDRGITPIPEDEVTHLDSETVLWNKPDPTCTILVGSTDSLINNYDTLKRASEYYGPNYVKDSILPRKMRAYPGKKVRIGGWFRYQRGSVSAMIQYHARSRLRFFKTTVDPSTLRVSTTHANDAILMMNLQPIPKPTMVSALRLAYISKVTEYMNTQGIMDWDEFTAWSDRVAALRNMRQFGTPAPRRPYDGGRLMPIRGHALVREHAWPRVRASLRRLGELVAGALLDDADDFMEAIESLPEDLRSTVARKAVEAWNKVAGFEELRYAGCGHLVHASEVTEVHGGGSVCESCRENYAVAVDTGEWHDRDDLFQHSDGQLYSIEPPIGPNYYRPQDLTGTDVGGRIRGYSDNVLRYFNPDLTIKPSHFGDFRMGIELEVEPEDGRINRPATCAHTVDHLCKDYAILKSDGSLGDGGFEIVTAPRGLKEHIRRFAEWQPHPQLRSWDTGRCGLHVHMSSQAFSQATLGKFLEFINAPANDDFILSIAGRHCTSNSGAQQYCRREGTAAVANPKSMLKGKAVDRYRMVNTTNIGPSESKRLGLAYTGNGRNINTVELRIFRGSLKKSRLLAQIEFAHAAVMFCRVASMRALKKDDFIAWLRTMAGVYPHLARWFGVRANTMQVEAAPPVRALAEV